MTDPGALLGSWSSFYVMVGSAAAALTGLMFVVITLVTGTRFTATRDGVSTFSTPSVVHFCCVLFIAALMAAPLHSLSAVAILTGLAGGGGALYVVRVGLQTRRLQQYRPDMEDVVWHVALPLLAYATLIGGAVALRSAPELGLYLPAAAVVALVFIGIHNAWDVVTYIATNPDDAPP